MFNIDPFAEETMMAGEKITCIAKRRKKRWIDTTESVDMKHNRKKLRILTKKLNCDPTESKTSAKITAKQIPHQLIVNGKPGGTNKLNKSKSKWNAQDERF